MIDLVITFITIILAVCACLISLIVSSLIIIHLFSNQIKREEKITLILSVNILIIIIFIGIIAIPLCINRILGEFYGYNFQSTWCIFSGYIITVLVFAITGVLTCQAIFRLCRIVYPTYKWLQVFWLYIISGPFALILGSAVLSPLLIWNDIIYLPNEYYCFIPFLHLRGILWMLAGAYGIPLLTILFIYFRITLFIHHQSNNVTLLIQKRQKRDMIVIQRIIITLGILIIAGIPTIVLILVANITGIEMPFSHRIQFISTVMGVLEISITTVILTPQVKLIVMKQFRRNRVAHVNTTVANIIPMGSLATIQ